MNKFKLIFFWFINNILSIILWALVFLNLFILFYIYFPSLLSFVPIIEDITEKLCQVLKENNINSTLLSTSLGALLGLLILNLRNMQMDKQTKVQYETFNGNRQFNNFLEATKLLTNKDSTVDAKVLLYDVAKNHPENIDRIIQVINKQLTPLFNCIENNCNSEKYNKKLSLVEITYYPKRKKQIYEYTNNRTIDINLSAPEAQRTIKEWIYKGNDTEKLISMSLYILKKIISKILLEVKHYVDLSHTIIFDIDTDFDIDGFFAKKLKFKSIKRPTENLIFLCCKLHKVSYKSTIYHQASFIDCDLKGCNFSAANLWGSDFINCNLEDVNFKKTECEGVEFKGCHNIKEEQIVQMKHSPSGKYTIVMSDEDQNKVVRSEKDSKLKKGFCFNNKDEYIAWKNNKND